jgi:hypothetical protein
VLVAMVGVLIQTLVRGRLMSLYALTFLGFMSVGALLAGDDRRAGRRADRGGARRPGLVVLYVRAARLRTL